MRPSIVVELRRRRPDTAEIETIARISAPAADGSAIVEAADPAQQDGILALLGEGVPDEHGRLIPPSDGEAYALALPGAYRGTRLWAVRID